MGTNFLPPCITMIRFCKIKLEDQFKVNQIHQQEFSHSEKVNMLLKAERVLKHTPKVTYICYITEFVK